MKTRPSYRSKFSPRRAAKNRSGRKSTAGKKTPKLKGPDKRAVAAGLHPVKKPPGGKGPDKRALGLHVVGPPPGGASPGLHVVGWPPGSAADPNLTAAAQNLTAAAQRSRPQLAELKAAHALLLSVGGDPQRAKAAIDHAHVLSAWAKV